MVRRHYPDDTTIDDVEPGHQVSLNCDCGRNLVPAWARWPKAARLTPLRDLRGRMKCTRCGGRRPAIVITTFGPGGQPVEVWRYPRP